MKRIVAVLGMAVISVGAFLGLSRLAGTVNQPKGFDPAAIPDVVEYTAGIPADTVVATVDGQPIPAGDFCYWMAYATEMMEYYYQGQPVDWTADMNGAPLAQRVKEQSLESAKLYRLVETKAGEQGISLTAEQEEQVKQARADIVEQLGGETAQKKWMLQVCLTEETLDRMNRVPLLYQNIQDSQADTSPASAEEMAEYIAANDLLRAKHILLATKNLSTMEELSDEEKAEKKAKAEEILAQLQESGDPEALFDELMHEHSEDTGLTAYPDGYDFTAGEMVAEFEAATRALGYGEISGIVESGFGYHIILRLDPADEALAAQVGAERGQEKMDAMVGGWMEEAVVETTEAYDKLDPAAFWESMTALRQEIELADAEAEAAAATPAPSAAQ